MGLTDSDKPSTDDVWRRALAIYRTPKGCWPASSPSQTIREARKAFAAGKLSRLDYLAGAAPLLALITCTPEGKADEWPPVTPQTFAVGLHLIKNKFGTFVRGLEAELDRPSGGPDDRPGEIFRYH